MQQSVSSTMSEHVFEKLREDLKANKFLPGDRLKFEDMCEMYSVSVGPLREALFRLVGLGLVTQIGQRGFRAAIISRDDIQHIIDTRKFLELRALRLALAHGDDTWESEVAAAYHLLKRSSRSKPKAEAEYAAWEKHHTAFHHALVAGCRNPWLINTWRAVFDQAERYRRVAMARGHWIIDQKGDHDRLMKAVVARDIEGACTIIDGHIGRSVLTLEEQAAGGLIEPALIQNGLGSR